MVFFTLRKNMIISMLTLNDFDTLSEKSQKLN